MAKCKNCRKLCDQYINDEYQGKWCFEIVDCPDTEIERKCEHYRVMSQADRIRCMTDEELGQVIFNFMLKLASNPDYVMSPQGYTEWLKSPVEV